MWENMRSWIHCPSFNCMVGGIEEKTRLHLSISLERLTWLSFDIENPSFFSSAARVKRGMSCKLPNTCIRNGTSMCLAFNKCPQCLVKIGSCHICCLRLRTSHGLLAVDHKHVTARQSEHEQKDPVSEPASARRITCINLHHGLHYASMQRKSEIGFSLSFFLFFLILIFFSVLVMMARPSSFARTARTNVPSRKPLQKRTSFSPA